MSIEELKAILDTIKQLGDGARWAFYWWLVARLFSDLMLIALVSGIARGIYLLIKRAIDHDDQKLDREYNQCPHCHKGIKFYWSAPEGY